MRRILVAVAVAVALSLALAGCSDATSGAPDAQSVSTPSSSTASPTASSGLDVADDAASGSAIPSTDQPVSTEETATTAYPSDSPLMSAGPADIWVIDGSGSMESLANGHLVNLGGCLGLQAQPVDDQLGLPLVFVGFAPDLLVDGTGIRSGSTKVRFGERVRVGGGQFDAPILADSGTREWLGAIPEGCPVDGFLFVAHNIELE